MGRRQPLPFRQANCGKAPPSRAMKPSFRSFRIPPFTAALALVSVASLAFGEVTPRRPQIRTESFEPQSITVSLAALPQPAEKEDDTSRQPRVAPVPEEPLLRAPAGFVVNVFAEDLQKPRWLALTPEGDVLVTETRQNRIRRLRDTNGDGIADAESVFAGEVNGLNIPFGMAFNETHFFLGNTDAVVRFPYRQGQEKLEGRGEKIAELPGGGYNQHWTRNVRVSPDGRYLFRDRWLAVKRQRRTRAARLRAAHGP